MNWKHALPGLVLLIAAAGCKDNRMADSSEKSYAIEVIDAFGNAVWDTAIDGVSGGKGPHLFSTPDRR
jgi:hypothetical protein